MQFPMHGSRTRIESEFGRLKLLDELPSAIYSNEDLATLAAHMANPLEPAADGADDEENPFVPAGYTYLGQFVDHDLTFDAHSNFNDPNAFSTAANERSPRFDLDNIYGRGPEDQPYLYTDEFDGKLLLGDPLENGVHDVQRNSEKRAIIGDPRNDENSIVVQIQSAFIRFHNRLVDLAPDADVNKKFQWARRQAQMHYQRILLDDFLPRIVDMDAATTEPIQRALKSGTQPPLKLYDLALGSYMPIEFSIAAYRFGHSMIRPGYRLSTGEGKLFDIFSGEKDGLRGFQRLDPGRFIDWGLFFSRDLIAGEALDNSQTSPNNAKGLGRTQLAYKIDTKLVSNLSTLPEKVASQVHSLAERNLRRGRDFGLPTGQDAAGRLGLRVLGPDELLIRPDAKFEGWKSITEISGFEDGAPLWFYILSEAEQPVRKAVLDGAPPRNVGSKLGELGGLIVLETFVGLMLADGQSVLNTPSWTSINDGSSFSMVELLEAIGVDI